MQTSNLAVQGCSTHMRMVKQRCKLVTCILQAGEVAQEASCSAVGRFKLRGGEPAGVSHTHTGAAANLCETVACSD
jgi:hypothetical protein